MNKIKKYEMPMLISISLLVFIALVSVSYAYFKARINNLESASTIAFTSGEMTINYENNSAVLTGTNIIPGWSTTKKFTLKGKNDSEPTETQPDNNMYYKIGIAVDINTFTQDAIKYLLEKDSTSSANGQMQDATYGSVPQTGTKYIGKGYFSETSTFVNHIYKLTISFPDNGENQSYDNNKQFAAHVVIEKSSSSETIDTPRPFAIDSWSTIASVVKENPTAYAVGSTKTIKVYDNPNGETTNGTYKEYTLRVANNTTPDECNDKDFSQTACGFVVEFVDILESREMNSESTNVGSWPASNLRTYSNGDFFNKLPSDLQNIIVDTKVISGHGGTSGETNFTSTDKIYLLSGHEVYEAINGDVISARDTAYNQTRQLDYYKEQGVTTSSYAAVIKKYLGSSSGSEWWLRSPVSIGNNYFLYIMSGGYYNVNYTSSSSGFSPAFRIG